MTKTKLEEFKSKLLNVKMLILNGSIINDSSDLYISQDDLAEEADLANSIINQQISLEIKEKELSKLRQVESALMRIEEGTYGFCADCDEPIEEKRLNNQPWAEYCIVHAEEREREYSREKKFA